MENSVEHDGWLLMFSNNIQKLEKLGVKYA